MRSKLGALWVILNPLAQVVIFALVLSNIMGARLPNVNNKFAFSIYLMSGILGWSLFSDIINRSVNLFLDNANLMKKINFPKVTLPVIMVGSCLLNNLFLLVAIFSIFTLFSHFFGIALLAIIPLTIMVIVFAFGIGLILGVINVFVRDISQVIPIALQVLFWFTPIAYPAHIIPEKFLPFLQMNPMFPIIEAYHDILLYNKIPDLMSFACLTGVGLIIMALGLFMFRKASPEMVDVL